MNKVILIGRLVRDPELRYTQGGVAVCNFTIVVDRPFTNQNGEREADFIDIVVWRKAAENVAKYMAKADKWRWKVHCKFVAMKMATEFAVKLQKL